MKRALRGLKNAATSTATSIAARITGSQSNTSNIGTGPQRTNTTEPRDTTKPHNTTPNPAEYAIDPRGTVAAVIVTHNRADLLERSIDMLAKQTRKPHWIIIVDNGADPKVETMIHTKLGGAPRSRQAKAELTARRFAEMQTAAAEAEDPTQPNPRPVYIPSRTNLGGAGGFALGFLAALALGADNIWCADDDGRPADEHVLDTLLATAAREQLAEVSPLVTNINDPSKLAFPLRQGLTWRRRISELEGEFLPGIASLFNGALISARALELVGVPDYRLFIRGDEVEFHRRIVRSGLRFGTCLTCAYIHPDGSAEFKPILGGRMHTQYPDAPGKRFFTYRNRGYVMSQPGMRRLLPQEYARFGWFFLIQRRDVTGFREWLQLHSLGRKERFLRP